MRRSPRAVLAAAAAVVVALATFRVVLTDLGALHRRAARLGPDVRVLVATRDLPVGSVVADRDLRVAIRPASTVAADAPHHRGDVVGRTVAADILRDDVVRSRHLAPREHPGLDGIVGGGRRAIHVTLRDGFEPPLGAVVDVLAAFDPAGLAVDVPGAVAALVVATGARVVAVDGRDEDVGGGAPGVTLLVTEAEARAVAYAATNGELTAVLAPPETACCTSPGS